MYFDRFDICEAYYVFASLYHGGQRCPIYGWFARFDRMRFRPSPMLSEETLSDNARAIFDSLVERFASR